MIKIAICDDEANIRAYLSSLIQAQDCPCEIVEYASAGDCLADTQKIDLLFLDIELAPSCLDGMELARKIRERATVTQPVIIFVTGYERYVFDAFDVGAFQYLLKRKPRRKCVHRRFRRQMHIIVERKHLLTKRRIVCQHAHWIFIDFQAFCDRFNRDCLLTVRNDPM